MKKMKAGVKMITSSCLYPLVALMALHYKVTLGFTLGPIGVPRHATKHPHCLILRRTGREFRSSRCFSASKPIPDTSTNTQVLYQKVVRPSSNVPDVLFLGHLVEYLEQRFQLPSNLPMIYDRLPGNEATRSILAWDSPLSPSPEATRMEVEVVGIYTNSRNESSSSSASLSSQPSVPQMALVVVRKTKSSRPSSTLPPMMTNLFQDSEKKILKSLDRGLEDFMAGKIKFQQDSSQRPNTIPNNVKTVEEAIQVELLDSTPTPKVPKVDAKDVVFDAYATEDQESLKATRPTRDQNKNKIDQDKRTTSRVAAAMATMKVKADIPTKSDANIKTLDQSPTEILDYAVQAAKRKAATKTTTIPKPLEDYAVAAARKVQEKKAKNSQSTEDYSVAAARKIAASQKSAPSKQRRKIVEDKDVKPPEEPTSLEDFRIPDYMGKERLFRTTISRPTDRRSGGTKQTLPKSDGETLTKRVTQEANAVDKTNKMPTEKGAKQSKNIARKEDAAAPDKTVVKNKKVMPTQEQLEVDVMKAAREYMDEMAEQGVEMSPEDLLRDVLKFGEEKEKEEATGSGFVSAAFDKAKELLQQQHQRRKAQIKEVKYKDDIEANTINYGIDGNQLSAEEELRKMFEAGERLAESRLTLAEVEMDDLAPRLTSEEDVDALVAKDKTISTYARSLDDELAELEVAINSSPGEELDGPRRNPMFDVFSGPEVYDPNVELDAVNYPGALPGTKSIELPKQLREAVQQSEFAVQVLSGLKTVERIADDGTKEVTYFYDTRELTSDQVTRLEMVAGEAIEIGLIRDPIRLVDENSRLQMLLDELYLQPDERFRDIAESYKDLLLSDNFVDLVKARMQRMADRDLDALRRNDDSLKEPHERERTILGQLVVYAQLLLKEARALGAELEAQQLEVIRSICQIAMDPKHQTEEETATALSDAVRDMRPLLDDSFVAYLKYAVAEEEAKLARSGLLDDPEHNQWLFILRIVQQGVYAEIAKSINRYIEHIWYVLRMETPSQRRLLLSRLIDDMPTLDVRPFVKVVDNMVGALGDATRGDFDGVVPLGEMTNKLLQLRRDVKELLPPERIAEKSRDADEWAARQNERLKEARKLGKQRLKAANDVAGRQDEIDRVVGRRGDVERFD